MKMRLHTDAQIDVTIDEPKPTRNWPSVLRHHRFTYNMKQSALAEDLGVTQAMISRWESGTAMPSESMRTRLEEMFEQAPAGLPITSWQDFAQQDPAMVAVINREGILMTASCGYLREFGLQCQLVDEDASLNHVTGEALVLLEALKSAGFFSGSAGLAESADLLSYRRSDGTEHNIYVHGLHWPRKCDNGQIVWIANWARISEEEVLTMRQKMGGQFEIMMTE